METDGDERMKKDEDEWIDGYKWKKTLSSRKAKKNGFMDIECSS